ncbi:MAG: hypothetical protein WED82_02065 [Balneolales bacterium]
MSVKLNKVHIKKSPLEGGSERGDQGDVPFVYDEFDPQKIHLVFHNINQKPKHGIGVAKNAWFITDQTGNQVDEIYLFQNNEFRFCIDNYPCQRKFYVTNMPYKTYEDFSADLERIGIELICNPEAV